jgi:hypothetical protein
LGIFFGFGRYFEKLAGKKMRIFFGEKRLHYLALPCGFGGRGRRAKAQRWDERGRIRQAGVRYGLRVASRIADGSSFFGLIWSDFGLIFGSEV